MFVLLGKEKGQLQLWQTELSRVQIIRFGKIKVLKFSLLIHSRNQLQIDECLRL